jgi:hypothetical protein
MVCYTIHMPGEIHTHFPQVAPVNAVTAPILKQTSDHVHAPHRLTIQSHAMLQN